MIYITLKEYLNKCIHIANHQNLKIIVSFHQTSKSDSKLNYHFYSLPPRIFDNFLMCGFCNLKEEFILNIAKEFDSKIEFFLVDLEKKGIVGINKQDKLITGNLEGRLDEIVERKKILGIRFDSLTAEHVVNKLIKDNLFLYKRSILVIGLGKIGFKIALSLLECGNNVEVYSRNYKKTVEKCNCMDLLKPESTLARPIIHSEIESSLINKDLIIMATNTEGLINSSNCKLINKNARIISIGHNELTQEAIKYFHENTNIIFSRVDIGKSIINYVRRLLDKEEIIPKRKKYFNKFIVSGGYIGIPGDYIVDDADHPQLILGFIKEDGKFIRELSIFEQEKFK